MSSELKVHDKPDHDENSAKKHKMSAEASSKWAIIGPEVKSWVPYDASTDFPIQNLPYGVFSRVGGDGTAHIGVAIGDQVLDLFVLADKGFFANTHHLRQGACFRQPVLNEFMSLGRPAWKEARTLIAALLTEGNNILKDSPVRAQALVPQSSVKMHMPANIGDYTDFYSSRSHATNVGIMFRGKDNALQPNWLHLPVGYHGRSSSVVVSGTDLIRPRGQLAPDEKTPSFGTCKTLDFELEMAYFLGPGNELGHPIKIGEAADHVFGAVLMNDWSARDIQKWEYVPLGPFGAKNFGTTISPWVVTTDALQPFRTEAEPQVNPPILPYLQDPDHHVHDIKLEVALTTAKQVEPFVISRSNAKHLYWSYKQQLVHHTITGCNMRPADLIGSGTISGPEEGSFGSLLEISWKGTKEINLPSGEVRKFLQDGDGILIRGWCEGAGYRVGFGPCDGRILPALPLEEI